MLPWFISIVVFANYVSLKGDTVKILSNDSVLVRQFLVRREHKIDVKEKTRITYSILEKAYTSENGKYLLLYHLETNDSVIVSRVKFLTADEKVLWQKNTSGQYQYNISCAYVNNTGLALILKTNYTGHEPVLYLVDLSGKARSVTKGKWLAVAKVTCSRNSRYVAANTRKQTGRYVLDCLLFIDLKHGREWTYTFSDCLSCRMPQAIKIRVDDKGGVQVTYKNEVYTFASDGRLLRIEYIY